MTAIRALLLDADGVVQLPEPAWRASLEALCGDGERVEAFLADVFAAEKPCLTGSCDFKPALARVLERWGSAASVDEALGIWTRIQPAAGILEVAQSVRSVGVVVALATNQQAHRARFMANTLGYAERFDHLLFSCDIGHAKPSHEYFSSALARIRIDPAEALFIDDHETNVAAARMCGLEAEIYHLSEGVERIQEMLGGYGLGTV